MAGSADECVSINGWISDSCGVFQSLGWVHYFNPETTTLAQVRAVMRARRDEVAKARRKGWETRRKRMAMETSDGLAQEDEALATVGVVNWLGKGR